MKRIILSSTLLVLLVGITSFAPATKHVYSSDEAKCSITFPAEFTTKVDEKEAYKSIQTQAIDDEMIFMAIFSVHNQPLTEKDKLANISFEAFMEALGGEATGKESWKVKKNTGLHSEFSVSGENLFGDYCVVLVGQVQYQVVAVAPKDSWDPKRASKFFKSFKIDK